jgi:hypothetical protein
MPLIEFQQHQINLTNQLSLGRKQKGRTFGAFYLHHRPALKISCL